MVLKIGLSLLLGLLTLFSAGLQVQSNYFIYAGVTFGGALMILLLSPRIPASSRYPAFIGFVGMAIGMWAASIIFPVLKDQIQSYFTVYSILSLAGFYLGFQGSAKFSLVLPFDKNEKDKGDAGLPMKILDTSSIIDGRIIDVCETGFVEGVLIIPKFVLTELQQVADSTDPTKRSRGRKGLTELNRLKQSAILSVKIYEKDYYDTKEVDSKLVKMCQEENAALITTDYNLNKIASLNGIRVLNVNELANSLKPVVMSNEEIKITVIKKGKDANQGIGYLDDGTMVVVDGGADYLGKEITVLVTSVLQTAAGRMIFTQPKH